MKKTLLTLIFFSLTMFVLADKGNRRDDSERVPEETPADTINLDRIVVTATRTPNRLKEVPELTRVITKRQIESMGNVQLEDILQQEFAGAEFHQAGYGTTVSLQGLDARYVLFLINGERMAGETYGNIDFSRIPVHQIERIEIVKGASSVLYGSNAMGAVVNIVTREPQEKSTVAAQIRYGGYYERNFKPGERLGEYERKMDLPNFTASGYAAFSGKKFRSATQAVYQSVDAYQMLSTEREKRYYKTGTHAGEVIETDGGGINVSGFQTGNVSQEFWFTLAPKVEAYVKGGVYLKNRYDFAGAGDGMIITPSEDTDQTEDWAYENNYGYTLNAQVKYSVNDKNFFLFSLFADTYFRREQEGDAVTPKQRHQYLAPRVVWRNTPDRINRITVGTEMVRERLNYDLTSSGYEVPYTFNTLSVFAQDEVRVSEKFSIDAGFRIENYGFDNLVEMYRNFVGKPKQKVNKKEGFSVTPKAAFIYRQNRFTWRLNYAMGFRNPSLKEKYMVYYQPVMGLTITGNPDLVPERNQYVSLSGEYAAPNRAFHTSLNLYANFFRDKIDVYQEQKSLIYHNTAKSRLLGIEWTGNIRLLKGWLLQGNYSYVALEEEAPADKTSYIFTSPHTATLQTSYSRDLKKGYAWGVSVAGRYIGKKEYEDRIPLIIPSPAGKPDIIQGVYTVKLPGYMIWNLSVRCSYKNRYTLTAGVNNLFNYRPKVVSFNAALTPGINGFVQLSALF